MEEISSWIKEINPNYNPFLPPKLHAYNRNCGACAFAVETRLSGGDPLVAGRKNIRTDEGMEEATGKQCVYMPAEEIARTLRSMGPKSHLIVGINRRPNLFGQPQSGHWFNAFYDGEKIYVVDGQCGKIFDWPHNYGGISEWCALI